MTDTDYLGWVMFIAAFCIVAVVVGINYYNFGRFPQPEVQAKVQSWDCPPEYPIVIMQKDVAVCLLGVVAEPSKEWNGK
jgi:hypothetical protein